MEKQVHTATTSISQGQSSPWLKIVLVNLLIWLSICTVGATGNYQDIVRMAENAQPSRSFFSIWLAWINDHVPLFVMSSGMYLAMIRRPRLIESAHNIVRNYLFLSLCYFPIHMLYISIPSWYRKTSDHSIQSLLHRFLESDNFTWFFEFAWFSGTFAVSTAVRIWHLGQARMQVLQMTQQANLELHLAVEKQRLIILQQQLEPHFIFNALNAISALVRLRESVIALQGINQLSALLRFALTSSKRQFVTLAEELQFIKDYLGLQELRYGARLQYHIDGDQENLSHTPCPPLLLQPLVENALRHDLDCHEGQGSISIHIQLKNDSATPMIAIEVKNTRSVAQSTNPGVGLGLAQTQERLAMLYVGQAEMHVQSNNEYFSVHLVLPMTPPEHQHD